MNTKLVAAVSAGPLILFGASMLFAPDWTIKATSEGFQVAGTYAGLPWQIWMVVQFLIGLGLAHIDGVLLDAMQLRIPST